MYISQSFNVIPAPTFKTSSKATSRDGPSQSFALKVMLMHLLKYTSCHFYDKNTIPHTLYDQYTSCCLMRTPDLLCTWQRCLPPEQQH